MADTPAKSATPGDNAAPARPIPLLLPEHGFENLDTIPTGDLGEIGAEEVITRAAVLLMSGAAERLGVVQDSEPTIDLEEARPIIAALAGMLDASRETLGPRGEALVAGLQSLQDAFRSASRYPDARGDGPGEKYLH